MSSAKDSWIIIVNPFDIDKYYPICAKCMYAGSQYTCTRLENSFKFNMVTGKVMEATGPVIKCWESRCGKEDYHCGKEGKFFQERN